jgi:hypothetical protein
MSSVLLLSLSSEKAKDGEMVMDLVRGLESLSFPSPTPGGVVSF